MGAMYAPELYTGNNHLCHAAVLMRILSFYPLSGLKLVFFSPPYASGHVPVSCSNTCPGLPRVGSQGPGPSCLQHYPLHCSHTCCCRCCCCCCARLPRVRPPNPQYQHLFYNHCCLVTAKPLDFALLSSGWCIRMDCMEQMSM